MTSEKQTKRRKGWRSRIEQARKRVSEGIAADTDRSSRFSIGLAGEGYAGGYRDALDDVLLVMVGVKPYNRDMRWWRDWK